jgi:hypothetical protein
MSRNYKKWAPNDIQYVLDNQSMLDKEIAAKLTELTGQNITPNMVRRQRRKMGIVKSRGRRKKIVVIQESES